MNNDRLPLGPATSVELPVVGDNEVLVEKVFKKCQCGIMPVPHYHIDDVSVIPWTQFLRALKKTRVTFTHDEVTYGRVPKGPYSISAVPQQGRGEAEGLEVPGAHGQVEEDHGDRSAPPAEDEEL